ncbi:MAG: helix-turn-helix domain-containing protein [Hylemonella sp.]
MSGSELRFLRKRLDMTQADVAALGGKTEQVVAKWEKETLPVPKAEASLLRLAVLSRFGTKEEMSRVVSQLLNACSKREQYPYVIKFDGASWSLDDSLAIQLSNQLSSSQRAVIDFGVEDFGNVSANTVALANSEASGQLLFSPSDRATASLATLVSFSDVGAPRKPRGFKFKSRPSRVGTGAHSPSVFITLQ